ncbi:MAG TPA: transglycosylase domain-containing protein [Acidimicrobiales bacterium]|nr:transglycosylase domain-containing protein [Acidimicrobiales bacterium]
MAPGSTTLRSPQRRVGAVGTLVATVVGVGVLGVAVLSAAVLGLGLVVDQNAPELPDPEVDVAAIADLGAAVDVTASRPSVVLDSRGQVVGRFADEIRHEPYPVGEVPANVERVLLASEDQTFRDHRGFDPRGIARALVRNASEGGIAEGGSTITQQLAKNLFTGDDDTFERKLEELQVAIDLEERFSKDEILTAYVNTVFLGNGAVGFEAAAQEYFARPASELTLDEVALLVGVLPAPSDRDPRRHPAEAEEARRVVLQRLLESGEATRAEVDEALRHVPEVLPRRNRAERFPYYLDYVRRYLLDVVKVPADQLYRGGLTIRTGLDPELQFVTRLSVLEHLPDDAGPEAAVAVVDVGSGFVKALVGGRSFDEAQVNLALGGMGAGSGRQPGSSFKPFVLAAALERGVVPDQVIGAPETYLPTTVEDPKPVHNFTQRGYGQLTLFEATIQSINTTYVMLAEAIGPKAVRDTAESLGVGGLPAQVGPSIGIGSYEASPLDMATAYAGFAADGRRVQVSPVSTIHDATGRLIADLTPDPAARPQAIRPETARWVTAVLEQNVLRGTATRGAFGRPAAAKTGTSNDYGNAWLVGHTPQLAAAVWVGFPEGNVPMRGIYGLARVTGGSIPALIWHDVMAFAHRDRPVVGFAPPPPPGPHTVPLPGGVRLPPPALPPA